MTKACTVAICHHARSESCKLFRPQRGADSHPHGVRISSIRRYKKGFSKEVKICPCHSHEGQKHEEPIFSDEKPNREVQDFPNMKIFGNGDVDGNEFRALPENTTCVPVTANIPKVSSISGKEIFYELTQVMELQKLYHLMEQEMVNRFKILQELDNANDGLASATARNSEAKSTHSKGKISEQAGVSSLQSKFCDRPASQTSKEESGKEPTQESEAREREALLVLRPDLIVPELRDLPILRNMLTVPSTLTEAIRLIFELRKDMLVLRNGMLKRALAKAEEQIEKCRKRRPDKEERLMVELKKVFSKAQLTFFRDGGKSEPWALEDYLQSISLRMLCSHGTFEHVRNTMKFPLPSMHAVRSMSNCGLMPEVTKRYKELTETKEIRFNRRVTTEKSAQDAETDSDGTERPGLDKLVIKRVPRSGAGKATKRNRAEIGDEPEPLQSIWNTMRPCWDASTLGTSERGRSDDDESESGSPYQVHQLLRVPPPARDGGRGRRKGRVRDRGKSREGVKRSERRTEWTGGKRGPEAAAESTHRGGPEYLSAEESDQDNYDDMVSPSREVPSYLSRMPDPVVPQSHNHHWDHAMRSPHAGWGSPPRRSPKKKKKKKDKDRSLRDRMMRP